MSARNPERPPNAGRNPDSYDDVVSRSQQTPQIMELGVHLGPMPLAGREKLDFWTRYYNSPISRSMSF